MSSSLVLNIHTYLTCETKYVCMSINDAPSSYDPSFVELFMCSNPTRADARNTSQLNILPNEQRLLERWFLYPNIYNLHHLLSPTLHRQTTHLPPTDEHEQPELSHLVLLLNIHNSPGFPWLANIRNLINSTTCSSLRHTILNFQVLFFLVPPT